jgi:hypothetical protein
VVLVLRGRAHGEAGPGPEQEHDEEGRRNDGEQEAGQPQPRQLDAGDDHRAVNDAGVDRARVEADPGEHRAARQRGDAEGERQRHQRRPCVMARPHPVDQRRDRHPHQGEDHEDRRQERDRVDAEPGLAAHADEGAQHHPLADREVHDVEDAERQREADADRDVQSPDQQASHQRLDQQLHFPAPSIPWGG